MRWSAAALSTPALLVSAASAQLSLQTATIVDDGLWNNPSSVGVDADGVVHVAFMKQFDTDSDSKEIWYGNNAAGGGGASTDFTFVNVTNNSVREEYPSLVLDADGNVHLAFHTATPGSNKIVYTTNAGGVDVFDFGPIVDITGSGYIITNHDVGPDGSVHFVFYTQGSLGAADVFYRRMDADGTLGPLTPVGATPGVDEVDPDVAGGPDGTVHIVYNEGFFGGPLVYVNDAGGSFAPVPTGVGGSVVFPLVGTDSDGRVTINYRSTNDALFLVDQQAPGGAFGEPVQLTPAGTFRPTGRDRFAYGPDDLRYFVFAANVGVPSSVWLVAEEEPGAFSDPILVREETPGVIETAWSASVAVGPTGLLAATYSLGYYDSASDTVIAPLELATAQLTEPCAADFDGDGEASVNDLLGYLGAFRAGDAAADTDGDGSIDVNDLLAFLGAFRAGC